METIVKESVAVVPQKPLLRYHQREELKQEIEDIDAALNPHNPFKMRSGSDVAEASSRMRRLKKQMQDFSPPEVGGSIKDKLYKRSQELEEQIVQGMPSAEEMRKNPAGMVGRHMRWEKKNKKSILEWKNIQQMLEPDSNDPDLSNFERIRPSGEMDRFRGDAQINGYMTYGRIPQENWDQVFQGAKPNSALEQVKKVAAEAKIDKRTLPRTEEQKRVLAERLALARAKQAETKDPVIPQEGDSVPFEGA